LAVASLSLLGLAACSPPQAEAPAQATAQAAAPAAEATGLAAVAAGTWTAVGTEPFWELKVSPGQPLDVTVEGTSFDATGPYAAPVIQADGSAVITTGNLVVTLSAGPCRAIGPKQYPYTATVSVDGEAAPSYSGCAETPTELAIDIDEATGQPVTTEAK
jgi:uncharacterized membrane protein